MSCFDFSTLLSRIPQNKLIKVLNELTEFCAKRVDKNYISVIKITIVPDLLNITQITLKKSSLKKTSIYLQDVIAVILI